MKDRQSAFSLVEVVLALGVVGFATIAILGVLPIGLQTSHSSQDETRAAQIAQTVLASLASQAIIRDVNGQPILGGNGHMQLNNAAKVPIANNQTVQVDLTASFTPPSPPAPITPDVYASNDGQLTANLADATYAIIISKNTSPAGFDPPSGGEVFANEVTLSIAWPPNAPTAVQNRRNFTRILSKY
jgi:type II secretory pathway pseudopilin PulG